MNRPRIKRRDATAIMRTVNRHVATLESHTHHRCTTCMDWVDDFEAGTLFLGETGAAHLVITCRRCASRMATGRATRAMADNLLAHLELDGGGE